MATITEGLAEIKTALAKISKKEQFVKQYCWRPDVLIDPFKEDGGASIKLRQELQAMTDLWERIKKLRIAIQKVNLANEVSIGGRKDTVAGWLVWRRDIAQKQVQFAGSLSSAIANAKSDFLKNPKAASDGRTVSVIVEVDESALAKAQEGLQEILGTLDGQLSLFNATTQLGEI